MIGSVKSNFGHAEPASGFTQIGKVIIAFETGFPPHINYTSPRDDIDAFVNGVIHVVTEAIPLQNGYIGINSFGFGGSNAHMLLEWNTKQKVNNATPDNGLSRLVLILSGRTEESGFLSMGPLEGNCILHLLPVLKFYVHVYKKLANRSDIHLEYLKECDSL
ncbi:fatty acid synthase-like [Camponotus floridanus]|uniref:fatty acid synthase-like n=1 Tax=Camponotus floridanus TaxID=104421 RepID=UPI000DC668D4|nr:fatty acid synthase-like [Camponotus floridanus]